MPVYRVSFFKEVCSDTGEDVITIQGAYPVQAADASQAAEEAKRRFCRERNISHWAINADRYSTECFAMSPSSGLPVSSEPGASGSPS